MDAKPKPEFVGAAILPEQKLTRPLLMYKMVEFGPIEIIFSGLFFGLPKV
jgi:hypothetical protein